MYVFIRRHLRGLLAITILYSILFDFFQQTLLIDGLSPTQDGIFSLRLPAGTWLITSMKPPIPNGMPFPLWGPFVSITTNYFDYAATPLSLGLTLSLSFLLSVVILAYVDLYKGVSENTHGGMGYVQALSLVGVVVSCSCEFLEGLLGAVEPAVPLFESTSTLLAVTDIAFLVSAIFVLSVSSVLLVSRLYGLRLFERFDPEELIAPLLVVPLGTYALSEFFLGVGPGTLSLKGALIVVASLVGGILGYAMSRRPKLLLYPVLTLTYVALGGMQGLIVVLLLGAALGLISKGSRLDLVAIPAFALIGALLSYDLVASYVILAGAGLLVPKIEKPSRVIALQTVTWTPVMLGPLAVVLGPALPFPMVPQTARVEAYLFLWLAFTPVTWYLGLKAIMAIVERSGFSALHYTQFEKQGNSSANPGLFLILAGALAIGAQYGLFASEPYLFLVGGTAEIFPSALLDTFSLAVILAGVALVAYGLSLILENSRGQLGTALFGIVRSHWTRGPLLAFGLYLLFSLASVGTFGLGAAPASMALPSVTLFVTGPPLYVPAVTLYLTRSFGLVVVPEHILVSLVTAYLFSLNIKALTFLNGSRGLKGAAVLGGIPAVALACPTCTAVSAYFVIELLSVNLGLSLGILTSPLFDGLLVFASWAGLGLSAGYIARKIAVSPLP